MSTCVIVRKHGEIVERVVIFLETMGKNMQ